MIEKHTLVVVLFLAGAIVSLFRVNIGLALIGAGLAFQAA